MPSGGQPLVSIILPTRNRLNDLPFTLERIHQDHYSSVEVLVGDDASDVDPRPEIARRFPAVRVERNSVRAGGCALVPWHAAVAGVPVQMTSGHVRGR